MGADGECGSYGRTVSGVSAGCEAGARDGGAAEREDAAGCGGDGESESADGCRGERVSWDGGGCGKKVRCGRDGAFGGFWAGHVKG